MLSGAVLGAAAGVSSWLGFASTFPGGLGAETFLRNTGKQLAMMAGNCVSLGVGAAVCVAVTFATRPGRMTPAEVEDEWRKTFAIDNPLRPWARRYKDVATDQPRPADNIHCRPPLRAMVEKFGPARRTAAVAAAVAKFLLLAWAAGMCGYGRLDEAGFAAWTAVVQLWLAAGAAYIMVVPALMEVRGVMEEVRRTRGREEEDEVSLLNSRQQEEEDKESVISEEESLIKSLEEHMGKKYLSI